MHKKTGNKFRSPKSQHMKLFKTTDVQDIITRAGHLILEIYHKQNIQVELKQDDTPVTEADKGSDTLITNALRELFPDIPIISEESSLPPHSIRQQWQQAWVVDPLDGTKEFISRTGQFCINIGFIINGHATWGMINNPLQNEILWGNTAGECRIIKNNTSTPITKTDLAPRDHLRVAISQFNPTPGEMQYINRLGQAGYTVELIPSGASSKQCLIAKGLADICPKFGPCSEWDIAAGHAIIKATGGIVINAKNHMELTYNKPSMLNPPFIMYSRRILERIKTGETIFLPLSQEI